VKTTFFRHVTRRISEAVRDRKLVAMDHLQEAAHCGSYGHVIEYVTWSIPKRSTGQGHDSQRFEAQYSETVDG